jgi:hypothetical protein
VEPGAVRAVARGGGGSGLATTHGVEVRVKGFGVGMAVGWQ